VPLATYTGWNPRHASQGAPEQSLRMYGATVPFAPTPSVREESGDVRLSVAERYPSREVYCALVRKAAEALIAEGYLLPADLDDVVQRAIWRYNLCTAQS
jgi:alpha/beta hydrolase family protein